MLLVSAQFTMSYTNLLFLPIYLPETNPVYEGLINE